MAEAPRLFLITPPIADAHAFAPLLRTALAGADVASLLLRTKPEDEPSITAIVQSLAPIAQAAGVAVLIVGDARLAARLDVDGVQVEGGGQAFDAALEGLKPNKIVGASGLRSRDDMMTAGERGADYLMLGGPDDGTSHATIRDEITWWAELFNVPCVGYARQPELASELAAADADFIGLCEGLWETPETIARTLANVRDAIAQEALA